MLTEELHPDSWLRIIQFLRTCSGVYVGREENCRRFLTGILWIARTGDQLLLSESAWVKAITNPPEVAGRNGISFTTEEVSAIMGDNAAGLLGF